MEITASQGFPFDLPACHYRLRVFVPAGLLLPLASLPPLPCDAVCEVVREGGRPQPLPDDGLRVVFDLLLDDGSASARDWMQGLMRDGAVQAAPFLVHPPGLAVTVWQPWQLPRLSCALDEWQRWWQLPQVLFACVQGHWPFGQDDLEAMFAPCAGRLTAERLSAGDRDGLAVPASWQLPPEEAAWPGAVIVVVRGDTMLRVEQTMDRVARVVNEVDPLRWQIVMDPQCTRWEAEMIRFEPDALIPDVDCRGRICRLPAIPTLAY